MFNRASVFILQLDKLRHDPDKHPEVLEAQSFFGRPLHELGELLVRHDLKIRDSGGRVKLLKLHRTRLHSSPLAT
jgi:hypothetical protein